MGTTRVTLAPLQHAQLRDAVHHMTDDLWRAGADRASTLVQRPADALVELVARGAGQPLDLGRSQRYASDAPWVAALTRDGGCVVGGCTAPIAWCDTHHGVPWNHDGPADLANLWVYCATHHTRHHREGRQGQVVEGRVELTDASGTPMPTRSRTGPNPLPAPGRASGPAARAAPAAGQAP